MITFVSFHLLFCLIKMSAVVSQGLKVQKCLHTGSSLPETNPHFSVFITIPPLSFLHMHLHSYNISTTPTWLAILSASFSNILQIIFSQGAWDDSCSRVHYEQQNWKFFQWTFWESNEIYKAKHTETQNSNLSAAKLASFKMFWTMTASCASICGPLDANNAKKWSYKREFPKNCSHTSLVTKLSM